MKKVAIVILNYNGARFLTQFLPSVISNASNAAIYVADNASTDNSVQILKEQFPDVQLIQLAINHGFAQGYNEALAQIDDATYFVLLNSDVEVTPNWVQPIVELMDSNPTIAACQPKIKDFYNKSYFEYAGAAGGFIDKLGYPFCRGRIFNVLEEDKGQYNDNVPVFWATGACMFVRADVYKQLGGFDGDFFAHMEEIDLCWRMQHAGYQIYYCGQSEVYHVGGGTLHKSNPHKTFLNFRNGLAMLYKNSSNNNLFLQVLTRLVLDGLAGAKFLFFDSWQDCWAVVRAHFNFYVQWKRWHQKRKTIIHKAHINHIYPHNIVWLHFAKGIKYYKDL